MIFLYSCCSSDKYEYTYSLTYTDGTTESVKSVRVLTFVGEADCVSSCNCSNRMKWCGVRKLTQISKRKISPKTLNTNKVRYNKES